MKRYHLTTFGCQMNEHDSERMKGMLESLGYDESGERDGADLILFNTCSIRESADNRLIGNLGEAKRLKREDPSRVVGVGGCWSQSLKDQVFEQFPFVDVAFGPGQIDKLGEFLHLRRPRGAGLLRVRGLPGGPAAEARAAVPGAGCRSRSAATACARTASCRPRAGASRAGRPRDIVREVEALAADGVNRGDAAGPERELLRPRPAARASGSTSPTCWRSWTGSQGISRVRYTSPHPKDMREKVIVAHAELPSLCEHIHLPLQSGSSRILKAMRRTYDRERYMERVAVIREHVPDCAITTDIIVGFPGETEDDFRATLEVAEEVGYDSAFTFVFSPRRGTEAANAARAGSRIR